MLRGTNNLVFANSRSQVEEFADILRRMCDRSRVPNEFLPHHGSLSKGLREDVEAHLKEGSRPLNAICTSTLELGIDIGDVKSIAQVDAPWSVASLRQRLGRSGRRGEPSILRLYIREPEIGPQTPLLDTLRLNVVQSIAMVQLLVRGWCEPPAPSALHLSTLVQQVLSQIAQYGGVTAAEAWRALCQYGPFQQVDQSCFAALLRSLASHDLLEQSTDGTLLLGLKGERIVNHFSFYAAFEAPDEYRLVHDGRPLGTMPLTAPLDDHFFLIFAGRRWQVVGVDEDTRTISVRPARGGRLPHFASRQDGDLHDEIRKGMVTVYQSASEPSFLDATAQRLLQEGRAGYARLGLDEHAVIADGKDTLVFCWRGDQIINTVFMLMARAGMKVEPASPAIRVLDQSTADVMTALAEIADQEPPTPLALASTIRNKRREKHDRWLDDDLLSAGYASTALDVPGAIEAVRTVIT